MTVGHVIEKTLSCRLLLFSQSLSGGDLKKTSKCHNLRKWALTAMVRAAQRSQIRKGPDNPHLWDVSFFCHDNMRSLKKTNLFLSNVGLIYWLRWYDPLWLSVKETRLFNWTRMYHITVIVQKTTGKQTQWPRSKQRQVPTPSALMTSNEFLTPQMSRFLMNETRPWFIT